MTWGAKLWDRVDAVNRRTNDALAFAERIRTFVGRVAEVEKEYGARLRAVCAGAPPTPIEQENTTFNSAWQGLLSSVQGMADAREELSSKLLSEVCQPLRQLIKDKTAERANHLKQIAALNADLEKQMAAFEKKRKGFEKYDKDAEAARAAFDKIESNEGASAKKVEQTRQTWASKAKACEEQERKLKDALDELNDFRTMHFHTKLPAVLDAMQSVDEQRAASVMSSLSEMVRSVRTCIASETSLLDGVSSKISAFNAQADSEWFENAAASGKPLPDPLPFKPRLHIQDTVRNSPKPAHRQHGHQRQASGGGRQAAKADASAPEPASPEPQPEPSAQSYPTGTMMYDFPGTNDGELPCSAGEALYVLEDDGSGWVLVTRGDGVQGYVPATYLQVHH